MTLILLALVLNFRTFIFIKIKWKYCRKTTRYVFAVSIGIHENDIENIKLTYNLMSQGYFIHASPTLFNSGTNLNQLFVFIRTHDSLKGIYKNLSDCAAISKTAGGIGIHISNIRGNNSIIKGTTGKSDGIIPMLRVYNETARYVNQGGRRPGSIAFYLEPWHVDIIDFLQLRKNTGNENNKTRDLFLALWIPDIFMKHVESNKDWYLMCPNNCPELTNKYGEEFEKLYFDYVEQNKYVKCIKARDLWNNILESQIETGLPYICFKDNINKKSNQINIGIIKSSNLCAEITEYSDNKESAVCNLSSIAINKYVKYKKFNNKFKIYSKDNCEYCTLSKMLFKNLNLEYEEIILNNKSDKQNYI